MSHHELPHKIPSSEPERFDDLAVPSPEDAPPVIAQVELTGKPRRVAVGKGIIKQGDNDVHLEGQRVVRIVVGLDTATGDHIARPLADTAVYGPELPHEPLARYSTIYDNASEGSPTKETARKGGASIPYVNPDEATIARDGDPTYRIKKPAHSFGLPNTYEQIYGDKTESVPNDPIPDELRDIDF